MLQAPKEILEHVDEQTTVLDIGCGYGELYGFIAEQKNPTSVLGFGHATRSRPGRVDTTSKRFSPIRHGSLIDHLAQRLQSCACICCDIAPIGIAVAQNTDVPSVLIENFTWDWIYEPYLDEAPGFESHIAYLHEWFKSADHHIQTLPVGNLNPNAITVNPVSCVIRQSPAKVHNLIDLPDNAKTVMITMGGTPFQYQSADMLEDQENLFFLLPNSGEVLRREGNLVHIPHDSPIFHPDLVNASDVVISKVGYSTLAEVYTAGTPYGYIPRPNFRESGALIPFIEQHIPGLAFSNDDFESGQWLALLPHLLALPRASRNEPNGANQVADFLFQNIL